MAWTTRKHGNASARFHHPEELSLPGSATRFTPRTLRKKTSDFLSPQAANRHMLRIPFVEEECT